MLRSRRCVPIRIVTLAVLLWVGFDVGAHGLLTCDFPPVAGGASAVRADAGGDDPSTAAAPDHCFCHGIFESGVAPADAEALAPAGSVVLAGPPQVPRADGHPLDRPPQLTA